MRCNHSAHLSAFLPQGNEEVEPTDKPNEEWKHDDLLGEPIHEDMAHFLRTHVMNACRGTPQEHSRHIFPGSQPVSLDSQNLQLLQVCHLSGKWHRSIVLFLGCASCLQDRRYYVTWKADGTRYMLLLRADGTYLIDRFGIGVPTEDACGCALLVDFASELQSNGFDLCIRTGNSQ